MSLISWSQLFAQLVAFDKTVYKLNDKVRVKVSLINPDYSTDSIKIFSDLLSANSSVSVNKTGWTEIGKIQKVGIYNFRFRFAQDTSRYFQLAIISPTTQIFNRLTERVPLLMNIVGQDLSTSLETLNSGFETLEKSNWPQLEDSTKTTIWLISYKAYQVNQAHFHLIGGAYCLLEQEKVGAKHIRAILTKFSTTPVNKSFAIASQVLIATPSLTKPALNKQAEKSANIAPFLGTLNKRLMGKEEKIRFFYSISTQANTAVYAVGIN